jgi:hypothetical protein
MQAHVVDWHDYYDSRLGNTALLKPVILNVYQWELCNFAAYAFVEAIVVVRHTIN